MRAVIQRVERASVSVEDETRGQIGAGFLVLIGVEEATATPILNTSPTRCPTCASLRTSRAR